MMICYQYKTDYENAKNKVFFTTLSPIVVDYLAAYKCECIAVWKIKGANNGDGKEATGKIKNETHNTNNTQT